MRKRRSERTKGGKLRDEREEEGGEREGPFGEKEKEEEEEDEEVVIKSKKTKSQRQKVEHIQMLVLEFSLHATF